MAKSAASKAKAKAKATTASKAKQATAKAKAKKGKAKVLDAIENDDSGGTAVNNSGHYVCSRDRCLQRSVVQTGKDDVSYCKVHDAEYEGTLKKWSKECWNCGEVYYRDVRVCIKEDCGKKMA